jgi:hypothetical protein
MSGTLRAGDFQFRMRAARDPIDLDIPDAYTWGRLAEPAVRWRADLSEEIERCEGWPAVRFGERRNLGLLRSDHASWFVARALRLLTGLGSVPPLAMPDDAGGDSRSISYEFEMTALDATGKPVATLTAHGSASGVVVSGHRRPAVDERAVFAALVGALFADPAALAASSVDVTRAILGGARSFGWDGRDFLSPRRRKRAR